VHTADRGPSTLPMVRQPFLNSFINNSQKCRYSWVSLLKTVRNNQEKQEKSVKETACSKAFLDVPGFSVISR